jgi:hypothetical protein
MTTPRTVAGQAWLSGTRPFVRRALAQTIVAIEDEAIAPYAEALRKADRVLGFLAAKDLASTTDEPSMIELIKAAEAAHQVANRLLVQHPATNPD